MILPLKTCFLKSSTQKMSCNVCVYNGSVTSTLYSSRLLNSPLTHYCHPIVLPALFNISFLLKTLLSDFPCSSQELYICILRTNLYSIFYVSSLQINISSKQFSLPRVMSESMLKLFHITISSLGHKPQALGQILGVHNAFLRIFL